MIYAHLPPPREPSTATPTSQRCTFTVIDRRGHIKGNPATRRCANRTRNPNGLCVRHEAADLAQASS